VHYMGTSVSSTRAVRGVILQVFSLLCDACYVIKACLYEMISNFCHKLRTLIPLVLVSLMILDNPRLPPTNFIMAVECLKFAGYTIYWST